MHNQYHRFLPVCAIVALLSSCAVLIHNIPDVNDHKIFPCRIIETSPESVFYFEKSVPGNKLGKEVSVSYDMLIPDVLKLDEYFENSKTAALIVIRNDTILYEKYNKKYQENSIFNIFSVTKLFMTTLTGIALDEGKIDSLEQPITEYVPELSLKAGFDQITIRHLLLHTSGIRFSDSPIRLFGDNAKYYYTRDLRKLVLDAELETRPGEKIHYSSVNAQLLGLIIERATGTSLSNYMQEKLWKQIGMQYQASWSLDNKRKEPFEKAFSNFNCTAIDLAKLGRLYLNKGAWNNQQILSEKFIDEAICRDTTDGSCLDFQYNVRFDPMQYDYYYTRGLYGQLIFVHPGKKVVIVSLTEADLKYNPPFLNRIIRQIVEQI